jgi:hypothetical protein
MTDIGSQEDIKDRLKSYTPPWYGDESRFQNASLEGFAKADSDVYKFLAVLKQQSRLKTATSFFLDLASEDFLNGFLRRRPHENDDVYRKALLANILREKSTKKGIAAFIKDYTGHEPIMFEPWNHEDVGGAYNVLGFAWNNPTCYWGGSAPYTGYITVFLDPIHFKKLWGLNVPTVGWNFNQANATDTLGVYMSAEAFNDLLSIPAIIELINFFKCYGTRVLIEFREVENG